jgi:transposase
MAWKEVSSMSQREEFVVLASVEGANSSELCRRFGVSRKTGYKWLARYVADGVAGLADQSRRPLKPSGRRIQSLSKEPPD